MLLAKPLEAGWTASCISHIEHLGIELSSRMKKDPDREPLSKEGANRSSGALDLREDRGTTDVRPFENPRSFDRVRKKKKKGKRKKKRKKERGRKRRREAEPRLPPLRSSSVNYREPRDGRSSRKYLVITVLRKQDGTL